ncbi:fused MFS/spermidine synthase [Thiomicrospira microaerophila]|uniref:fused MFS/spermidine synthase n=1 Tax=Thiomicrospira microaerophila TaxID=406020 RepID=UPI0005CB2FDC|nr:fused MFS/spermidine synthase [Thiomicrospira microaerophila]
MLRHLQQRFKKAKLVDNPVHRYGGEVVHTEQDEFGLIQVIDSPICRSLHFDSAVKQNRYFFKAPMSLAFEYQQIIEQQLWQRHIEKPLQNLLMLGVGGGSLASKLFISHPQVRMTLVELRPTVIEIAHDFFHLPIHSRIQIHTRDAAVFIEDNLDEYDVIVVDVFDDDGMPTPFSQPPFLNNLLNQLQPGNMLLFNLWQSTPEPTLAVIDFFEKASQNQPGLVELIPIKSSNNLILSYVRH